MHQFKYWLFACFILLTTPQIVAAEQADERSKQISTIDEKVKDLVHMDGFFDLYWNQKSGQLLLRVDRMGEEFIYQSSMPRGVGSNDLGLDRGQLGSTRLVEFLRSGPKILLVEKNTGYRANSSDANERAAVESSFARSVIWGFELVAESDGSLLINATDFFLHDAHGLANRLSRAQQGKFKIDSSRSAIFLPRTRAFPDNTEIESIVSYIGELKYDDKGKLVSGTLSSVAPDPTAVTVHLHHSFIRLPDDNYEPLPHDPRSGFLPFPGEMGFMDYASPIGDSIRIKYARRHRLEKKHPEAAISEAVEPIIYYLDPGAPEPVRSALMEGASWWNQAFEAAGYKNAFQVKLLPEDADPMDVRYNVIQWVHRSTRGWSYGYSVVDPRTGEIMKGHVSLGSLRVRQDYLIAEGLLAPYEGDEIPDDMLEMSLARIRQLSAHEVGHTIGFEHNFAASVDNRSSVMDYPFPLIKFNTDGSLDLSDAYGVGIGDWDKRSVMYAYQDFPETLDDPAERRKILEETIDSGLLFVADTDARNPGASHPYANLWDNGKDAIVEFEHLLKVRAYALGNFSERNIRPGRPMATIEEVLVPIYLLHRYQIQAVGKLIGGQYFNYTLRGDKQPAMVIVDAAKQQAAIDALLAAIDASVLVLPQSLVDIIPPRPPGFSLGRESFSRSTGISFDPLSPAASAISLTLDVLLNPQRAARMNVLHAADYSQPGFLTLLHSLNKASWLQSRRDGVEGAIQRIKNEQVLQALMALASNTSATAQVRGQALLVIQRIDKKLTSLKKGSANGAWAASYEKAKLDIARWLDNPSEFAPGKSQNVPPGSPIGG